MEGKIFEGRTALVVGGTSGIGREISLMLARNGAGLIVHGRRESEMNLALIEECSARSGKRASLIAQDLLSAPFSEIGESELFKAASSCDMLCLCFGPFVRKPLHETRASDWEKVALYDYALPGLLVSASIPHMMAQGWGRILLFGGTGTRHRTEFSTNAAYAGAKSALNVLLDSAAAFYAGYGITCNMILPGFTETEYQGEEEKAELGARMPLGTMISPESIAENALFLLKNADTNGVALRVDRGWTALKSL